MVYIDILGYWCVYYVCVCVYNGRREVSIPVYDRCDGRGIQGTSNDTHGKHVSISPRLPNRYPVRTVPTNMEEYLLIMNEG
jgi:hypothetical protein